MSSTPPIPLPRGWTKVVRSGVLHAISVASAAMTHTWSQASSSRSSRARERADADRLRTEVALLTEELALKDARWARVPARRRPHYGPILRMRILELRAARGWSNAQTAERFLVTEDPIATWMRRLDREGEAGLVQVGEPVNKFPAFVGYLVRCRLRDGRSLLHAGLRTACRDDCRAGECGSTPFCRGARPAFP